MKKFLLIKDGEIVGYKVVESLDKKIIDADALEGIEYKATTRKAEDLEFLSYVDGKVVVSKDKKNKKIKQDRKQNYPDIQDIVLALLFEDADKIADLKAQITEIDDLNPLEE